MSLKGNKHTPLFEIFTVFLSLPTLISMATGEVDELMRNFPRAWNLQDAVVQPGQAFIYKLPPGEEYRVSESSLEFLPEWLEFHPSAGELRGVPRRENLGRNYFFHVEVLGNPSKADFFRVTVKESDRVENDASEDASRVDSTENDPHLRHNNNHHHHHHHHQQQQQQSAIRCKKSKSRTTATVILNVSLDDPSVPASKQLGILESFSSFYDIPLESLRLASSSEIGDRTPFDSSALVAGPGDVKPNLRSKHDSEKEEDSHAIVRWTVGCGSVQNKQMSVLQRVEKEAIDGRLRRALGHGVIGWYVTNQKPKDRNRRFLKSGIFPTPTPTISAIPPTAISSFPTPKIIYPVEEATEVEPLITTVSPVTLATGGAAVTEDQPVTKATKSKTKSQKKKTTLGVHEGFSPTPSPFVEFANAKSFDLFEVQIGEVFLLEVTPDFFTAPTTSLDILTVGGIQLNDDSWIKLSAGSRPLVYGIPLLSHEGLQDYILQGKDAAGSVSRMTLKFRVVRVVEPLLFEANMIFRNIDFDRFGTDVDLRMDLARRIASSLGDRPPSDVLMTKLERGSLDYWWTNRTLSGLSTCPEGEFRMIQESIIDPSNFRVDAKFLDAVDEFGLQYVEFHPRGQCRQKGLGGLRAKYVGNKVAQRVRVVLNATSLPTVVYRYPVDDEEGEVGRDQIKDDGSAVESNQDAELLKQIMIPVLIVVVLIVLSTIVACLVCKRRDKQPKSSDSTELVSKGAPVIFAHELNDAPPSLSPRALVPAGGGRSPRPPNYHRRALPGSMGSGYGDFYATEGLMSGQARFVSS